MPAAMIRVRFQRSMKPEHRVEQHERRAEQPAGLGVGQREIGLDLLDQQPEDTLIEQRKGGGDGEDADRVPALAGGRETGALEAVAGGCRIYRRQRAIIRSDCRRAHSHAPSRLTEISPSGRVRAPW
jgi:hypothetical protein